MPGVIAPMVERVVNLIETAQPESEFLNRIRTVEPVRRLFLLQDTTMALDLSIEDDAYYGFDQVYSYLLDRRPTRARCRAVRVIGHIDQGEAVPATLLNCKVRVGFMTPGTWTPTWVTAESTLDGTGSVYDVTVADVDSESLANDVWFVQITVSNGGGDFFGRVVVDVIRTR